MGEPRDPKCRSQCCQEKNVRECFSHALHFTYRKQKAVDLKTAVDLSLNFLLIGCGQKELDREYLS